MHLHSDKIFFPNSCHHSINTPWNVPKKIMNASSEPKRVNSLVPSVNFLILHIKSYHYQNTNNASFVVYVIQSQHYQNTNNASFVVYVIQSQHHQNTNNASLVVYVFQSQRYQDTNNACFVVYVFQKTNKNKSHSSKIEFVRSFFGGNVGLKNHLDFV